MQIGEYIGSLLQKGDVIALDAHLGGGKTLITKGIVKGALGLDTDNVTSPAFSLVNEYGIAGKGLVIYHMDFYRLDSLSSEDFGMFDEYLNDKNGIVIAEWGSRFINDLCNDYLSIKLEYVKGQPQETRLLSISKFGNDKNYIEMMENIEKYVDTNS